MGFSPDPKPRRARDRRPSLAAAFKAYGTWRKGLRWQNILPRHEAAVWRGQAGSARVSPAPERRRALQWPSATIADGTSALPGRFLLSPRARRGRRWLASSRVVGGGLQTAPNTRFVSTILRSGTRGFKGASW